jgi:DNA polymerase
MPEDLADEIATLAAHIRVQLAFYREIGITDIGGSIGPPSSFAFQSMSGFRSPAEAIEPASQEQHGEGSGTPIPDDIETAQPSPPQFNLFGEVVSPSTSDKDVRTKTTIEQTGGLLDLPNDRSLDEIRKDLGECTRCRLHQHRTHIVFGEGDPAADLVFVGEGPGADEDRTGRPFVGKAGRLLDKIIDAMGMSRGDVYICNVVKCRPPENRTPERDEAATCGPFLFRQLGFIRPKVIVALGAPALQCLTGSREGITKVRGHWQDWYGIKVMPTYHPAYLLRVPDKKKETWEDMKRVRDFILNGGVCS